VERAGRKEELVVTVPPQLAPATRLRLKGKGEIGPDGRPGDLYLKVQVKE
jgi:DnaJ-class molecular chaperone